MANALALIDYGAGNLHSVHNALKAAGACDIQITNDPKIIQKATRIVLPGVGSYHAAMKGLDSIPGLIDALEEQVIERGVPFLGVCVGMQLLATQGLEHGETAGLGWIAGEVRLIEPTDPAVKVPHMGWNDVVPSAHDTSGLVVKGEAYFLHSYHFVPKHKNDIAARTNHGEPLVAAIARDNILGVQYHPEKSQKYGLDLMARFLEWQP